MAPDDAVGARGGGGDAQPVQMHAAVPILDDAARSPDSNVCPFFRREVDGALYTPLGSPDEENVCAAIGVPKPQSARQQELVCLRTAHADCPRYLRGAMSLSEPLRPRRQATVPRATLAALLILVLSAGISFGFVVQRGGIELPVVAPSSSAIAIVTTPVPSTPVETPAPTDAATPEPSPSVAPTVEPTASPTATPVPTPTPTPVPTATPAPTATPKPTATPTSNRYALLTACPDKDGCWIYVVRSGDNLFSIANYFGHSLSTLYAWNPQYPGTALKVGAQIRMPPPTR